MMKNIYRYSVVFLLEIIFTILSILALYYTRMQTKLYIDQITALSPVMDKFTQEAAANNITNVPLQEVIKLESLLNKALLINDVLLPIAIVVLFILTQMFVWKLINKTPLWKSLIFTVIPSVVFLFTILQFTNFIYGLMSGESYSLVLFIVLLALSIILSYLALMLLVNYQKPKEILKILKKKWKRSLLPFVLLIVATIFYLIMFTITLISAIAEYLGIVVILLTILSVILFSLARYYFVRKVR